MNEDPDAREHPLDNRNSEVSSKVESHSKFLHLFVFIRVLRGRN